MIMVSACLAGINCRFDGTSKPDEYVMNLAQRENVKLFCPECLGGLVDKRPPSELTGTGKQVLEGKAKAISKEGKDVTERFLIGAERVLSIVKNSEPERIILKAKSPSCGVGKIYDGSFSGTLVEGNGICAQLLIDNGYNVECR